MLRMELVNAGGYSSPYFYGRFLVYNIGGTGSLIDLAKSDMFNFGRVGLGSTGYYY